MFQRWFIRPKDGLSKFKIVFYTSLGLSWSLVLAAIGMFSDYHWIAVIFIPTSLLFAWFLKIIIHQQMKR
jgi:hypothetical protein